jgi:hypothetical protein
MYLAKSSQLCVDGCADRVVRTLDPTDSGGLKNGYGWLTFALLVHVVSLVHAIYHHLISGLYRMELECLPRTIG